MTEGVDAGPSAKQRDAQDCSAPAVDAHQRACSPAGQLPAHVAGKEDPSIASVKHTTCGAGSALCSVPVSGPTEGRAASPLGQRQQLLTNGHADYSGIAAGVLPRQGQADAGNAAAVAMRNSCLRPLPATELGDSAHKPAGCEESGDADEPLSQRPLAEIRQQMLASQPKRTTEAADHLNRLGQHVQLSQVPLAARASQQLAQASWKGAPLPQKHGQQPQVQPAQQALMPQFTADAGRVGGTQRQAQAQPSQVPSSLRAAFAQHAGGSNMSTPGADDARLSQLLLAARATSVASQGTSRALRGSAEELQASAGRTQSWLASAAHLRMQQQQTPPLRWSDSGGGDQENDPLEDMTLHQRQWVASKQLQQQRRGAMCGSSRTAGHSAPSAAPVSKAAIMTQTPHVDNRTPKGACPDSADASQLLGSARAAAAEVVARVQQQAEEAVRELERKISGIVGRRVSDAKTGVAVQRTGPRPACMRPSPDVPPPAAAWLPPPDPGPKAPCSAPCSSQPGAHKVQAVRQQRAEGRTGAAGCPAPTVQQRSGVAALPGGSGLAPATARACSAAGQAAGALRAQPASAQTPRDSVGWSGAHRLTTMVPVGSHGCSPLDLPAI